MNKRILTHISCLLLSCTISMAQDSVFSIVTNSIPGDVEYRALSDSTAEARCVNREATSVTVEQTVYIDGKSHTVTKIAYQGFMDCIDLAHISMPNTVTEIGDFAFQNCKSLKLVALPLSLERIGDEAFQDCYSLRYLKLPEGLKSIGDFAFWDCDDLVKAYIPNSVETIEYGAFHSCDNAEIVIDNSRQDIKVGEGAFKGVKSVTYKR